MTPVGRTRAWLSYAAMLLVALAFIALVLGRGALLEAPTTHAIIAAPHAHAAGANSLVHALLALATIIAAARGVGAAFERWLGQPAVLGEIAAGLALGPSVLDVGHLLVPDQTAPTLGFLAKLGVVLFMFLVGLEFDPTVLRGRTHATLSISHASIVVPFSLGTALALVLYPRYGVGTLGFAPFALFIGVSVSVTAFPVLVRILASRRLHRTSVGVMAIACAAIDDATAWCLLAFVSGVASAERGAAWTTLVGAAVYVTTLFVVVRPLARKLAERIDASPDAVPVGALGMRTRVGLLATPADAAFCVLVTAVATFGKLGGSFVAARFAGLGWRESSALGVLMNTRGLMELIVLNVGLEMGVLSPTLFTMLVIMALVTTFATTPLLDLLLRGRGLSDAPDMPLFEAREPP